MKLSNLYNENKKYKIIFCKINFEYHKKIYEINQEKSENIIIKNININDTECKYVYYILNNINQKILPIIGILFPSGKSFNCEINDSNELFLTSRKGNDINILKPIDIYPNCADLEEKKCFEQLIYILSNELSNYFLEIFDDKHSD